MADGGSMLREVQSSRHFRQPASRQVPTPNVPRQRLGGGPPHEPPEDGDALLVGLLVALLVGPADSGNGSHAFPRQRRCASGRPHEPPKTDQRYPVVVRRPRRRGCDLNQTRTPGSIHRDVCGVNRAIGVTGPVEREQFETEADQQRDQLSVSQSSGGVHGHTLIPQGRFPQRLAGCPQPAD